MKGQLRFHPTLVLAQPPEEVFLPRPRGVSIPHWFSLNEVVGLPSRMKIMFPSHIGSRSTHPSGLLFFRASSFPSHIGSRSTQQADEVVGLPSVSIPHWFSLNKTLLHSTKCTFKRFHPTLVLAQRRKYVPAIVLDSFPSHIGSRSTRFTLCTSVPTRSFPSHIGSRSTMCLVLLITFLLVFPSHIGSRSTKRQLEIIYTVQDLFPSHIGSRSTWFPLENFENFKVGFHPTLVLAQLLAL